MKLTQLKLLAQKKPLVASEEQHRRNKLIRKLQEQQSLAEALLAGTTYSPTRTRTVKDEETGMKRVVSVNKRVKAWWFNTDGNRLALAIRYGSQVLELGKGKFSIDIADTSQLMPTLQLVIEAVREGELDTQIANAAYSLRKGFKK